MLDGQIAAERKLLDAAATHGLRCWLWLGDLANFPGGATGTRNNQLLTRIVQALRGHAALAAYKGMDEPGNPLRSPAPVPAAGMVRAYKRLKQLDPKKPVVVVQAPRGPVAALEKYRPTFDITGCDIYPVSYPPQTHSDSKNRELSVVGDLTRKTRQAAGTKPFWMTLQVAWTGVLPTQQKPHVVPRFPSLPDERFMAYEAIVNGARGLVFFGGHLTDVMTPEDAASGWNWTYWRRVLRPVVSELASSELRPALLAPDAPDRVVDIAADERRRARGAPRGRAPLRDRGAAERRRLGDRLRRSAEAADGRRSPVRVRPVAPAAGAARAAGAQADCGRERRLPRLVRAARRPRVSVRALG